MFTFKQLMNKPKKQQFAIAALMSTAAVVLLQLFEQITGANFSGMTFVWLAVLGAGLFGLMAYIKTRYKDETLDEDNGYHISDEKESDSEK